MCCGTHVSNLSDLQVGAVAEPPSGASCHTFRPSTADVPESQGLLEMLPMVKGAAEAPRWVSPTGQHAGQHSAQSVRLLSCFVTELSP